MRRAEPAPEPDLALTRVASDEETALASDAADPRLFREHHVLGRRGQ